MVTLPPPTGPSRVVEVLNDAVNRVIQNQNVASLNFADPQLQASLARQQQVLSVTSAAIVEGSTGSFDHQSIQASAIANVGTQFIASTVGALIQERRAIPTFTMNPEPNLTVSEVSEVTRKAIAQAVDILPLSSSEVEVLMAAKAYVETSRGTGPLSEPQLMNVNGSFGPHTNVQELPIFSHGSSLPLPPL
jgi:hypothetical protein